LLDPVRSSPKCAMFCFSAVIQACCYSIQKMPE
jgi:hypothetical protein